MPSRRQQVVEALRRLGVTPDDSQSTEALEVTLDAHITAAGRPVWPGSDGVPAPSVPGEATPEPPGPRDMTGPAWMREQ